LVRSTEARIADVVRLVEAFGESDESGSSDKTQNDLVGAELTFDALPGDFVGLSLKQAIL
jgi:hypothetical protein